MSGVNGLYSLLTEAGADENVVDIVSIPTIFHGCSKVLKSYAICLYFYTSKSQDVLSSKKKTNFSRTGSVIGKDLFEKYSSNAFLSPGLLT